MLSEYNYHTRIMGCDFDLTFLAESEEEGDCYFIQALEIAQNYEEKFSRFRNESELMQLNTKKSMKMTDDFLEVYEKAQILYEDTEGGFNSLIQVGRIGYDRSFEKMKSGEDISFGDLKYDTCMEDIRRDDCELSLKKDQCLDFGGFLKGYVTQKIAQESKSKGLIINIGGDIYTKGLNAKNKKFIFTILHPQDKKKNIQVVLKDKALCTSGTYKRKWKYEKKNLHHIVNPYSKISSGSDLISASVMCKDGYIADAYATYAIILGMNKAEKFLVSRGVNFVLIDVHGKVRTLIN